MTGMIVGRRKLIMLYGASLPVLLSPGAVLGQVNATPCGFSAKRPVTIPQVLQRYIDDGSAAGFVRMPDHRGEFALVNTQGLRGRETMLRMERDAIWRP
jgi:hypothetical protein